MYTASCQRHLESPPCVYYGRKLPRRPRQNTAAHARFRSGARTSLRTETWSRCDGTQRGHETFPDLYHKRLSLKETEESTWHRRRSKENTGKENSHNCNTKERDDEAMHRRSMTHGTSAKSPAPTPNCLMSSQTRSLELWVT